MKGILKMNKPESMAGIAPVRLSPESRFKFECHPGVRCFTQCCRGINIILTPYDIIRLKNRLQLSSEEFLAIYTKPEILEKTDLPMVTLKLLDDDRQSCPFVRDDGCIVYQDRPTTCRYYPVGVAALSHKEGADGDEFYFFVNEPHCKGFEEDKEWTIREWRKDQGVDIHDEINAGWTDLIVRKRSFPKNIMLTQKAKELFFMASYNIDKFKRFVFESEFMQRFDIDAETAEKLKNDEVELLKFAMVWLKSVLFQEKSFQEKGKSGEARTE
jgi:Fe-S-cluster containining protein